MKRYIIIVILALGFIATFYLGYRLVSIETTRPITLVLDNPLESLSFLGTIIAALLAIPTLLFLYRAFRLQRNELQTTRDALELQKQEAKENRALIQLQQDEVIESRKALELQKIDSAFFNMLSMLEQIVNSMSGEIKIDGSETYSSRQFLRMSVVYLRTEFHRLCANRMEFNLEKMTFDEYHIVNRGSGHKKELLGKTHSIKTVFSFLELVYNDIYLTPHQSVIGRFYKYVYSIVEFIELNKSLSEDEKFRYIKILEAQLSDDELTLLFYHTMLVTKYSVDRNRIQFRDWLMKYGVLKRIPETNLFDDHYWMFPDIDFEFLNIKTAKMRASHYDKIKGALVAEAEEDSLPF